MLRKKNLSNVLLTCAFSSRDVVCSEWLRAHAGQADTWLHRSLIPFKRALKRKKNHPQKMGCISFSFELVLMTQLLCSKAIYLDDRYVDVTG